MTTFAHKTSDLHSALKEIKSSWYDLTDSPISLDFITDDIRLMTKDQKDTFKELTEGNWSYRLPIVVFRRGSKIAQKAAFNFLIDCSTKQRWEFWK